MLLVMTAWDEGLVMMERWSLHQMRGPHRSNSMVKSVQVTWNLEAFHTVSMS